MKKEIPRAKYKPISITLVKDGSKVVNPATAKPLEFGKTYDVPAAPYWHRRLKQGVVKMAEPKTEPAKVEKTDGGAKPNVK